MKGKKKSKGSAPTQSEPGSLPGRRFWTPEEDEKLHRALQVVAPGTHQRWSKVSQLVQISAKACRGRASFLGIRNFYQPTLQSVGDRAILSTQVTGDGEESEYDELSERMEHMGFTASEFDELISQGVRPWDDDAWDVLRVLNDGYYDEYSDDEYY